MRIVIQRVKQSSVTIGDQEVAAIGHGLLLLVGIAATDQPADLQKAAQKISKLRILEDDQQKMNLAIGQVAGEILSVSQFTLLADLKHGNRPSFTKAMAPTAATKYFDQFNQELVQLGLSVKTGVFGADMQVELTNDGPVTIIYDSEAY